MKDLHIVTTVPLKWTNRSLNTRIKAHIDEKEIQRLAQFSGGILKAAEQLFNRHLEKQKQLWRTTLAEQRRNLESDKGI